MNPIFLFFALYYSLIQFGSYQEYHTLDVNESNATFMELDSANNHSGLFTAYIKKPDDKLHHLPYFLSEFEIQEESDPNFPDYENSVTGIYKFHLLYQSILSHHYIFSNGNIDFPLSNTSRIILFQSFLL